MSNNEKNRAKDNDFRFINLEDVKRKTEKIDRELILKRKLKEARIKRNVLNQIVKFKKIEGKVFLLPPCKSVARQPYIPNSQWEWHQEQKRMSKQNELIMQILKDIDFVGDTFDKELEEAAEDSESQRAKSDIASVDSD